jgi:hypothetical protein
MQHATDNAEHTNYNQHATPCHGYSSGRTGAVSFNEWNYFWDKADVVITEQQFSAMEHYANELR